MNTSSPMSSYQALNSDLASIYNEAVYEVWLVDGVVTISLDHDNPILDNLCSSGHVWSLITAYNPYSQLLSKCDNMIRQLELTKQVLASDINYYYGIGRSSDDQWRKHSLCLYDVLYSQAVSLGRSYDQHAIIVGSKDHPAHILSLSK